ncbi:hypothetical protein [Hymenobacter sp. BT730]|uniref:hypothetical protein n=1 Tax=Hymenobacter sp. BT730 TaxID=3063332 RepID=UPI0026DF6719|nr:hypothetical protein [Hymenobacter sp. BT730]
MAFKRPGFSGLLIGGLLALIAPFAQAQRSFVQQFAGATVLLANGDTIRGPLIIHRSEDVIRITMPDQSVSTLSPVAVKAFAVKGEVGNNLPDYRYDDFYNARNGYFYGSPPLYTPSVPMRRNQRDTTRVRVFRTYRWNRDQDYSDFKSPGFFEQLSAGPTHLLRRQQLVEHTVTDPYNRGMYHGLYGTPGARYGYQTDTKDLLYLGTAQGEIVPLRNPKKDLLNFFRANSRSIEQYAKVHKLNFSNVQELAYIVNYANSLQSPPAAP